MSEEAGIEHAGVSEAPAERPLPPGAWRRDTVEFNRVLAFTDGVFAIALTLLIVAVAVPIVQGDPSVPKNLLVALNDMVPEFVSFFIAFILIGRYWMAHHKFSSLLRALDTSFIGLTLIYLAFVAFLPFPTALVGKYEENPVSVLLFAVCLSAISGLEVLLFRYAYRHELLENEITPEVYRYGIRGSLTPVVVFLASSPLAFISPTLMLCSWLISVPIGIWLARHAPEGADGVTLAGAVKRKKS